MNPGDGECVDPVMESGLTRGSRSVFLPMAACAIALGAFVLVYRGPGRVFVRGHVGDVAATMLVYAIVSIVVGWRTRALPTPGVRGLATMIIATGIEVVQVWFHASSTAGHLIVGSTFDPIDLAAYVVGVGIAIGWESAWERSGGPKRASARGRSAST